MLWVFHPLPKAGGDLVCLQNVARLPSVSASYLAIFTCFLFLLMLIVYMIKLLPNRAEAVLVAAIRL